MNENTLSAGDWVIFCGCTEEQSNWGNNDEPDMLVVGKAYEIERIEPHMWHTKLKLVNIDGKFNSVCFRQLDEDWAI
jgi:hypothetical protein